MLSLTLSLMSSSSSSLAAGSEPINRSISSGSKASASFLPACSAPKWGRMSVIWKTGSSGLSPMAISTWVPSGLATTP